MTQILDPVQPDRLIRLRQCIDDPGVIRSNRPGLKQSGSGRLKIVLGQCRQTRRHQMLELRLCESCLYPAATGNRSLGFGVQRQGLLVVGQGQGIVSVALVGGSRFDEALDGFGLRGSRQAVPGDRVIRVQQKGRLEIVLRHLAVAFGQRRQPLFDEALQGGRHSTDQQVRIF